MSVINPILKKRRVRDLNGVLVDRDSVIADVFGVFRPKESVVNIELVTMASGSNTIYLRKDSPLVFKDPIRQKYGILSHPMYLNYFIKDTTNVNVAYEELSKLKDIGVTSYFYQCAAFIDSNTLKKIPIIYTPREMSSLGLIQVIDVEMPSETACYALYEHVEALGLIEDFKDGLFYTKTYLEANKEKAKKIVQGKNLIFRQFNFNHSVNNANISPDKLNKIKYGMESPTYLITEGLRHTFGVELETCSGLLHSYDIADLNVKCVRDGSLRDPDGEERGGEYVTGILKGDAGFSQINKICKVLTKKCNINKQCGVHVHIGIEPTKQFIVGLYYLLSCIENETFRMFPASRRNGPHSKSLPRVFKSSETSKISNLYEESNLEHYINTKYDQIYKLIKVIDPSGDLSNNSKFEQHPLGDKCGYNRDTPRYCWVNFVPALFIRQNLREIPKTELKRRSGVFTIEFRVHSASLNFVKIRNWVKICIGIVNYAENINISRMLEDTPTLEKVLKYSYRKTYPNLLTYIKERTEKFELVAEDDMNEVDNFINSARLTSAIVK